jgi:hypothetical protein
MYKKSFKLRNVVAIATCLAAMMFFAACDKDKEKDGSEIQENGLTRDINDFISQEILDEIEDMGMPINKGGNPPKNITGTFISTPDICVATNRPNDTYGPGYKFADFYLTLSEQDNNKLTIKAASDQSTHTGDGEGAFIVGEGNDFSVFCPMNKVDTKTEHKYKTVNIFSGTITDEGIKDFYHSTFMISGGGLQWGLLENGQGRIIYDRDGMSERRTGSKSKSLSDGKSNDSASNQN